MSEARTVRIIGGGLAGLSLGVGLARRGVRTTLFEAGDFPRHRVCGEFIAGLDNADVEALGIADVLADARPHKTVRWWQGARSAGAQILEQPALGISRYRLDQRLAQTFLQLGGILRVKTRVKLGGEREGAVLAMGRRPQRSAWVGVKVHVHDLELASDLELHLGRSSYVGLCGVEDARVNVCGLFPRSALEGTGPELMLGALQRCGLGDLAKRIRDATIDPTSVAAVAGLSFRSTEPQDGWLRIGDSLRAIPPFTGHGMAVAFLSAAAAVEPLCAWAHGNADWSETVASIRRTIGARTDRRFHAATLTHGWLLGATRQPVVAFAQRHRLLPMALLTRLLHS